MRDLKKIFLSLNLVFIVLSVAGQSTNIGYSVGLKVGPAVFEDVYVEGIDLNITSNRFIYSATYHYNPD